MFCRATTLKKLNSFQKTNTDVSSFKMKSLDIKI